MKKIIFLLLILSQCNLPKLKQSSQGKEKFSNVDFSGDYPITDRITDIPALDESTIVPLVLENETLEVVFDRNTGRLVSLKSKETGWQMQRRASLSRSFRLAVPVPGRRDNCVFGERQRPCKIEISKNNTKIIFTWEKLNSTCDQNLDIRFSGIAELTPDGLKFTAEIENNSPYTIETVYWPYFGDINAPASPSKLNWISCDYGSMYKNNIYPDFGNQKGYWGVDYPTQTYQFVNTHFGLLENDSEGMYIGYDDTTDMHLVYFIFELKPGWFDDSGRVSRTDSVGGEPSHIECGVVHYPFINPKEKELLKPILFKPYMGDWQKGAETYKTWRKSWARSLPCPDWAKNVHSWQQLHINSSEDYPRCSYKDIVGYAKECAEYGIKVIQLTGWTLGGQDRGNPSHDIDPRLGTWDDLKNAITECEKLGVHIVLFNKYTWADESQPWFKNELIKYATKDPYGNYYNYGGYQYQTAVQLAGINTRRLIPMCQLSQSWRDVANIEFDKSIALGASGMLYDECQHHGGVFYCFDPSHGHHVPANVYSGDVMLESGFRKISQVKKADYLFAGEGIRDLQFRNYNISYFRIGRDHVPMHRYIAPEASMMIAIMDYNDRFRINQALLYRYIMSYEPRYFKGYLHEIPMTIEYGNKVDMLREKYKDFLWDGEFVNTVGAKVIAENNEKVTYSVFVNLKLNKRAVVVVNPLHDKTLTVEVEMENTQGKFLVASPETLQTKECNGKIQVPALSAVVLMEK